jgi:hypothetical protein
MEMHKMAMLPREVDMPASYRLWLQSRDLGHLWYDGGLSQQPHILMLEFDVCRAATASFAENQARIRSAM